MRSRLDVTPGVLSDLLPMFKMAGVSIVGTLHNDSCLSLLVEGEIIPDTPQVVGTVKVKQGESAFDVTLEFTPIEPQPDAASDWYVRSQGTKLNALYGPL